jgi:alpha-beta hydrolase superfamily lysophospholipase
MNHKTGTFQNSSGAILHYQLWLPNEEPKSIVALCHGIGEHSGRYMNLVHPLTAQAYAVCGYDHVGHGLSSGQRGHIASWEDYRSGLQACLHMIQTTFPDPPVFLFGHSMGSLIALDHIQRYPDGLQGLILSGTAIDTGGATSQWKILLAKVLSSLWPTFSIDLGLDSNGLSRDPQVVKAYEDDPLVQGKVSARWGTEMMAAQARTSQHPEQVRLPVLFLHGQDDPLSLVSGVRNFYAKIPYADKKLFVYEGGLHEPHNDLEHTRVAQDLVGWLEQHLPT